MNKACLVKGVNVSRIQSESLKVNLSGPLSLSIFSSVEKPRTCPLDCKSSPKKLFYDVARKEKKKKKKKLVARGSSSYKLEIFWHWNWAWIREYLCFRIYLTQYFIHWPRTVGSAKRFSIIGFSHWLQEIERWIHYFSFPANRRIY